jgi:hypothetical protein
MDEGTRFQIEAAADAVKQVITLATGVLTITLTFASTLAAGAEPLWQALLRLCWILLGLSVIAGVWFLLARAGVLYDGKPTDVYDSRLRRPWATQLVTFLLAVVLFAAFGVTQFEDIAAMPGP